MNRLNLFLLGVLLGVFIASITVGVGTYFSTEEIIEPPPWTIQERICAKNMIKEMRETDYTPVKIESHLEDCRYFMQKYLREM